jgi:hypothetical protein
MLVAGSGLWHIGLNVVDSPEPKVESSTLSSAAHFRAGRCKPARLSYTFAVAFKVILMDNDL